jgi:hypothetical protein
MTDFNLHTMMAAGTPLRFGESSATGCDYFDYAPEKPNLFLLMKFKQLLAQEHGIDVGFDLYRKTISKQKDATLRLQELESHYTYCKRHSQEFLEIFPSGESFTIMPPRVVGEGNHRPLENTSRSFFVACVEDARVRGRSSIIEVANVALADYQEGELERIDDELEFDSAVFHRDRERIWTISRDRVALKLDTAFSLLGCRTDFFGDWLCESIQKYVAATLYGRLPAVPILIDARMPETHRQALELMLAAQAEIIEVPAFETVEVKRLWSASGIGYMPFHQKFTERFKWDYLACSPERFLPVEDEMCRRADPVLGPSRGPSRVFLARKEFRHRKLAKRAIVEALAKARGFAIVYPEELDFIEQARLLRDARFVVAPEGSALFLCCFLSRGAKVCILNHRNTEGLVLYNGGCDAKDIELTIITGPRVGPQRGSPQDVDYMIDADVFGRFLADWLPAPALAERGGGS